MTLMPMRRDGARFARVSPMHDFEEIYDRLGQLMTVVADPAFMTQALAETAWVPAADISETDDAYLVEIDLPGADRADIDVQLDGSELLVTGEIQEESRERRLRRNRRTGRFEFRATLPGDIDADRVDASFDDGVLLLVLPKAHVGGPRHVQISEGRGGASSATTPADATATSGAPTSAAPQPTPTSQEPV
jgi:HSP20 family protein